MEKSSSGTVGPAAAAAAAAYRDVDVGAVYSRHTRDILAARVRGRMNFPSGAGGMFTRNIRSGDPRLYSLLPRELDIRQRRRSMPGPKALSFAEKEFKHVYMQ